jgi:hypothetical protein
MLARVWYLRVDDQLLLAGAFRRLGILVHTCDVINFQSFAKRTVVTETSSSVPAGQKRCSGPANFLMDTSVVQMEHTINH